MITVKRPGATYLIDEYRVTDEGLKVIRKRHLDFVKGNSEGEEFRQDGYVTIDLLKICQDYLTTVNQGELKNDYTTKAIDHLNKAILSLVARQKDRQKRGVRTTYKK